MTLELLAYSFNCAEVRGMARPIRLEEIGSYMVRPLLQDKIDGDRVRLLPYIRPLYEKK